MILATRTQPIAHALLVSSEDLQFLDESLAKEFAEVTYSATLEDGTKVAFGPLRELLDYENPDFKRIASLSVSAGTGDVLGDAVELVLGEARPALRATGSVFYRLKNVDQLTKLEAELSGRVRAMRPWYHLLTQTNFVDLFFYAFVVLFFASNAWSLLNRLRGIPRPAAASPITEGEAMVLVLLIGMVLYVVGRALNLSKDFLFPRVFFNLGRQVDRFRQRERIAQVLFGVIGLGIVVNLMSKALWP